MSNKNEDGYNETIERYKSGSDSVRLEMRYYLDELIEENPRMSEYRSC